MDYVDHRLVSSAAIEPLTVMDAKRQLRIEVDPEIEGTGGEHPDNDYLAELIAAAREMFEARTGRALATQQWLLVLDSFPRRQGNDPWWDGVRQGAMNMFDSYNFIDLPKKPVLSVDSITTYNFGGVASVVVPTVYDVSLHQGRVMLRAGQMWPTGLRMNSAVEVLYTAGYGEDPLQAPRMYRNLIQRIVAWWYENRVPAGGGLPKELTDELFANKERRL